MGWWACGATLDDFWNFWHSWFYDTDVHVCNLSGHSGKHHCECGKEW